MLAHLKIVSLAAMPSIGLCLRYPELHLDSLGALRCKPYREPPPTHTQYTHMTLSQVCVYVNDQFIIKQTYRCALRAGKKIIVKGAFFLDSPQMDRFP